MNGRSPPAEQTQRELRAVWVCALHGFTPTLLGVGAVHKGLQPESRPLAAVLHPPLITPAAPAAVQRPPPPPVATPCGMGAASGPRRQSPRTQPLPPERVGWKDTCRGRWGRGWSDTPVGWPWPRSCVPEREPPFLRVPVSLGESPPFLDPCGQGSNRQERPPGSLSNRPGHRGGFSFLGAQSCA